MSHIEYAEKQMSSFVNFAKKLKLRKFISGRAVYILCCLHITKETGVFVKFIHKLGIKIDLVASNPLSTNIEVVKELRKMGIEVFYPEDKSIKTLNNIWVDLLNKKPDYLIDDGGDLVELAQKLKITSIKGCCEETTTGVIKEKNSERKNTLIFPIIAVNNAKTKNLMDNHFGTGQSVIDGIIRSTDEIIAGKRILVCGYGNCGSGIAKRLKGLGAIVYISEINPIKSLQAFYDGYLIGDIDDICSNVDIIITATGCINTVGKKHLYKLKNGCILANAGHSDCEIDISFLQKKYKCIHSTALRDEFNNKNNNLILLGKGRIINLVGANGHPSEIMSLSYSSQIAALFILLKNEYKEKKVYLLPEFFEFKIAEEHLKDKMINLTKLTSQQKRYIGDYYKTFN